ncbi:hypothetical protein VTN31DRAFT_6387 [Thermomyces dupontii]|uniref:uncharacterized protein n=1 Tax=Talaromyces thermophilus TaxID=28565 RepID=UPI0037449A27
MMFYCGWSRVQELLFCQLLAITGSRPGALLKLRYRDISLSLLQISESEPRPRLVIRLRLVDTKRFLGPKPINVHPIPEIQFDPTLVLSPHIFLLGMLFHIKAFKAAGLDGPEKLYGLQVLKGLREQSLELRDEIQDKFVFCELIKTADGVRLDGSTALSANAARYTMRRVGEITGFSDPVTPYSLRYAAAKAFNDSPDVSEQLQNVIMQHANSRTFERHYSVGIHVDTQALIRGQPQEPAVMPLACSMRRTKDPRRPRRLTADDSTALDRQPALRILKRRKEDLCKEKARLRDAPPDQYQRVCQEYERAKSEYRNARRRASRRLISRKREAYQREQPVQDVERQLRGSIPKDEVIGALPDSPIMSPQHLALVEAVLQPPGDTLELDLNRRIAAVKAVSVYCGVVEGAVKRPAQRERHGVGGPEAEAERASRLREAMAKVFVRSRTDRPKICFLCLGDEQRSIDQRVYEFASSGSLTRHFNNVHLRRHWEGKTRCSLCSEDLCCKVVLVNHALTRHGTISGGVNAMCSCTYT